jgi:two-component system nitrogen regulation response regulator NtrX
MADILIVDDEKDIRDLVTDILKDEGYKVRTAKDNKEVFASLNQNIPTAIILDIWLQGSEIDGLGILELVKRSYPNLPVIVMSGHGNIETAVNSIKIGAYDYIEKPFNEERLTIMVKRACEFEKLYNENHALKLKANDQLHYIAKSSSMAIVNSGIDKISPTSSHLIIFGESGTGKRTTARIIVQKSLRSKFPFVELSVQGLTLEQIELEVFGSKEELYVSAIPRKRGALEIAAGGTLYIEELIDLPLTIQHKLLKYLVSGCVELAGSNRKIKLDVRIIVGTKYNLKEETALGNLNKDLYYRLNLTTIALPPLAKRKADIPELCQFYLKRLSIYQFSGEALAILQLYNWPGNIRELINIVEWLIIVAKNSDSKIITASMLPPDIQRNTPKFDSPLNNAELVNTPLKEARELFEAQYLTAQLERFEGNIAKTADFIEMDRTALYRKLKMLNISFTKFIA